MDSASAAILLVLGMVAFANYRNGTLGTWMRAKFFNQAPATSGPAEGGVLGGLGDALNSSGAKGKPSSFNPGVDHLVSPVAGATVTGSFGDQRAGHTHAGIDLAVPTGTPVDAAAAGTVIYAGPSSGYGLRVDVDHGGGTVTRYAHLSRISAGLGERVGAGDQLGLAGATGDATGPHLHFELRRGGVAVDPSPYLAPIGVKTA